MSTRKRASRAFFLFLAGLWCGALLFFASFGARLVLKTSPSRHAGGLVNRALLDALDLASFGAAGLLLILWLLFRASDPPRALGTRLVPRLLLVAAAAAFASYFVITPEMQAARERMGAPIDAVPREHPARRAWGRLHGFSTVALLVRLLATGGLFALAYPRAERRGTLASESSNAYVEDATSEPASEASSYANGRDVGTGESAGDSPLSPGAGQS